MSKTITVRVTVDEDMEDMSDQALAELIADRMYSSVELVDPCAECQRGE